jgi:hypothetical protein
VSIRTGNVRKTIPRDDKVHWVTKGSRAYGSLGRLSEDEINGGPLTASVAEASRFPERPSHESVFPSSEDNLQPYVRAACI